MMRARRSKISRACLIALIASLLSPTGCKAPEVPEPDAVFLLVVDTLRADSLSCYGATGRPTPNIDRLAAHGVTFTNTHSPSSWTKPAMASIMTSHYPTQLGLVEREAKQGTTFGLRQVRKQIGHRLTPHRKSLAGFMQEAGFLTTAFVNQPGLSVDRGFNRHYSRYFYPASPDRISCLRQDQTFGDQAQEWGSTRDALANDKALVETFAKWLQSLGRGPEPAEQQRIFAWLHLLAPHRPYLPPSEFEPPARGSRRLLLSARHHGEIMAEDILVGQALEAIARYVGFERSLIVFCSDHGEEFGEHGGDEHGHSLHGEVTRVPLIIHSPGLPRGMMVEQHVSTIDILPTILEITNTFPTGGQGTDDRFAGSSLVPLIRGGGFVRGWHPIYSEGMLYGSTKRSLIIDDHKLIHDQQQDRWRLYDIGVDPGETEDLASNHLQRMAAMREALERIHRENVKGLEATPPAHNTHQAEDDHHRTEQALEALGYVSK